VKWIIGARAEVLPPVGVRAAPNTAAFKAAALRVIGASDLGESLNPQDIRSFNNLTIRWFATPLLPQSLHHITYNGFDIQKSFEGGDAHESDGCQPSPALLPLPPKRLRCNSAFRPRLHAICWL
jgi:hypothetical protein